MNLEILETGTKGTKITGTLAINQSDSESLASNATIYLEGSPSTTTTANENGEFDLEIPSGVLAIGQSIIKYLAVGRICKLDHLHTL